MPSLIQTYWRELLGLMTGGGLLALILWLRKPAMALWRLYRARQKELQDQADRLVDGYQEETSLVERQRNRAVEDCNRLLAERAELEKKHEAERTELEEELRKCVRKLDLRDDINRQDRATMRTLRVQVLRLRSCVRELRRCLTLNSIDDTAIEDIIRLEEETDVT